MKSIMFFLFLAVAAPETHKDVCVRVCKEASDKGNGKYVSVTKCGCKCIDGDGEYEVMLYDCPEYYP